MIKSITFFWLILAVAASGALFRVSYRVQHLQKHLVVVNHNIGQEEEKIRVLQAEWSHLNDPTRLEALARKHLNMGPSRPTQIVSLDLIPSKEVVPENPKQLVHSPAAVAATPTIFASLKRPIAMRSTDE